MIICNRNVGRIIQAAVIKNNIVIISGSTSTDDFFALPDTAMTLHINHNCIPELEVIKKEKSFIHFQKNSFNRRGKK